MSRTYEVGCDQCNKSLWIGQGWPPERTYLYATPEHIAALHDFLFAHEGHPLRFMDTERTPDEWEGAAEQVNQARAGK